MFGGTGFLGSRIARQLCSHKFPVRIASRHPDVQLQSVAFTTSDPSRMGWSAPTAP
ncbi:hypothetical protein [Bradyrhizobium sp. CW9]|uniref:hypothetical protein n=1 Tax=Bradyrhizobium sp. CW9 TaxID=2782689 RepID=UPI003211DA2D